jgi:hypothetical protein
VPARVHGPVAVTRLPLNLLVVGAVGLAVEQPRRVAPQVLYQGGDVRADVPPAR